MTSTERAALKELLRWVTEDKGQTTASKLFELAWKLDRERSGRGEFSNTAYFTSRWVVKHGEYYWTGGSSLDTRWHRNRDSAAVLIFHEEAIAIRDAVGGPARVVRLRKKCAPAK